MENLVFTQLSVPEIRRIFREEMEECLAEKLSVPATIKQDKKFLTVEEASKFLNLAKQTIYGLVSGGKIPFMKQGKKLYFSEHELTEWVKNGKKETEPLAERVDKSLLNVKRKRG